MNLSRSPISIGTYEAIFQVIDDFSLPSFQSSIWRSVFGMQLKDMSLGNAACPNLTHISRENLYAYFMETPPPQDAQLMRLYQNAPHPYVFACPWHDTGTSLSSGESYHLPFLLFGKANALLSVVILAMARAAAAGLGRCRGRMRLMKVFQNFPDTGRRVEVFVHGGGLQPPAPWLPAIPAAPQDADPVLEFVTPLRLTIRKRVLNPRRFENAHPLVMNLIRRTSLLCAFHEGKTLELDFKALKNSAQRIRMRDKDLIWQDQFRYSSRTGKRVPLGGVMGRLALDISEAEDIWPFLWLGQWLHAGKGAVFGMGRYSLTPQPRRGFSMFPLCPAKN